MLMYNQHLYKSPAIIMSMVDTIITNLTDFLQSGVKKFLAWLSIEHTTLSISYLSGPYDLLTMQTPFPC